MLLADHLAQKTRRFGTDLRPVELSALDISRELFAAGRGAIGVLGLNNQIANAIKDSSSFSEPRNLENLPAFLEAHAENPMMLGDAAKENGSPHTIIVTGAGLRAAELARYAPSRILFRFIANETHRAVRKFQSKNVTVGKLVRHSFLWCVRIAC